MSELVTDLVFGDGFKIIELPNLRRFNILRDSFFKFLGFSSFREADIEGIRRDFCHLSNDEINKMMLSLLGFTSASAEMAHAFSPVIGEVAGTSEIFLQRRANFIINKPGEGQRHQWPHYELMSGISPFTYVIWAPLHDIDDEGGIFYLTDSESFRFINEEESRGLVNSPWMFENIGRRAPTQLKFGEAVIFNPFVLHGNIEYFSNMARFAVSIRFQSASCPLMQRNTDFFKYYNLEAHGDNR